MTVTYRLAAGDTLAVRADDGDWQHVTFRKKDFADISAATAAEIVTSLAGLNNVTASEDAGRLVLTSDESGAGARVEVDLTASSAGAALGLASGAGGADGGLVSARGTGLLAARVTSTNRAPFRLAAKSRMTVRVDGRGRTVTLGAATAASAQHVADAVNAALRRKVARATADDRVTLVSPTVGAGSSIEVLGPAGDDVPDAAATLGFLGGAGHSEPYRSEPARLVCTPVPDGTVVRNLTAAPVELHLPGGAVVLPAQGEVVLPREIAASPALSQLAGRGTVRLQEPLSAER
jgi:hypothetical protein